MAAPARNFRGVALLAVLPPEHRSAARARRGALGGKILFRFSGPKQFEHPTVTSRCQLP